MTQNPLADLVWLVEAGADEAIGEVPVDLFPARAAATVARLPERTPAARPAPVPSAAPVVEGDSIGTAQALARDAGSLAALKAALEGFDGCALKRSATTTVFADGNPQSRVLFIGEAPGRDED